MEIVSGVLAVGNNTYTGGTTIHAGSELNVGNGFSPGSTQGNVSNQGLLRFYSANDVAFAGRISGDRRGVAGWPRNCYAHRQEVFSGQR